MTQTQPVGEEAREVRSKDVNPDTIAGEYAKRGKSLYSFGGICAVLAGICYMLMGLTYFFDPTVKTRTHKDYWQALHRKPGPHILGHFFFGLASLFTLGMLPAIAQLVRPAHEALVRWVTSIAQIGYAALALFSFRSVAIDPGRAKDYLEGDDATKVAVVHGGKYLDEYDPNGYLQCGGVGLWLMVISVLAGKHGLMPKRLTQLGILGAILQWISMLGLILNAEILIAISAVGAVVVAPSFLIWLGVFLHHKAQE